MPEVERNLSGSPAASPNDFRRRNGGDDRPSLFWHLSVVFVAVVLVWLFVVDGLGSFFGPAYSDRAGHAVRAVAVSALVVPLILVARQRLDRRPWGGLGFVPLRDGWKAALFGAAFWLVAAGAGLAVTLALGWVRIAVDVPSAGILLLALYLPLLVFLYEVLPEELVFRGYFYRNLAARYARWSAVPAQAVLFALWATVLGAAGSVDRVILFLTFGLVLGLLRAVTGNLWAGIGFHLAFQWVAQLLSAAIREGTLRVEAQSTLDLVAFWFFPIILGSVAILLASALRKRTRWREPEPDPPSNAASVSSGP